MEKMMQKNQQLKAKYKYYVVENHSMPSKDPDIRDMILDSWKRCKENQIHFTNQIDRTLSDDELEKLLERNQNLINVAHNYMQNIYTYLKGTNFMLSLSDANGYILDCISDDSDELINLRKHQSNLMVGVSRNEKHAGTNGVGTALTLKRPVQIFSYEHYCKQFHNLIGTAAPIRDSQNNIIGCLDVLGPVGLPHNHTLAMVSAAADSIQRELGMMEAYDQISVLNKQLNATFNTIESGIITFNNMGIIKHYNRRACQILHLTDSRLEKENIANIFDLAKSNFNPFDETSDVHNREVVMTTYKGMRLPLSMSSSIIRNDLGQKTGTLLTISEINKTYNLVNKLSGFTATYTFDSIVGDSPEMSAVKKMARTAAKNSSNVLILGESGTGKELIAQAIHNASDRRNKPFIAINCASLPEGLIESELFGYASGAFTGAKKDGQPGKFELANGGTIFLDEIGDMPLKLQTSLLRVLQTREVVRIGGNQVHSVNVRVIAATNCNLLDEIKEKNFREDLYYRINVLPIEVPPLRERKLDIPSLLTHFISLNNRVMDKNITGADESALQALTDYNWPGNVREMQNIIERAVNLTDGTEITLDDLPDSVIFYRPTLEAFGGTAAQSINSTADTKNKSHQILIEALAAEHGNVSKAAERVGIPRRTFYRRIEKFNINVDEFRLL